MSAPVENRVEPTPTKILYEPTPIEKLSDCAKDLEYISQIQKLPKLYHPNRVVRTSKDKSYYTGCKPYLREVVRKQPKRDISDLKAEAKEMKSHATSKYGDAYLDELKHFKPMSAMKLSKPDKVLAEIVGKDIGRHCSCSKK